MGFTSYQVRRLFFLFVLLASRPFFGLGQDEPAYEEPEWIDWTGKGKPKSYLVIKVDTDCIVTLDAGQGVSVDAGEEIYIWYPGGTHVVEAVSNDGTLTFREEKKIKAKKQEFMLIALNPSAAEETSEEQVVNWDGRDEAHASLNVTTDTDCKITMDGNGEFRLRAGESAQVMYPKGPHTINAVSLTGNLTFSQEVKLKGGKQQTLAISLNPNQDQDFPGDGSSVRIVYWDNDSPPYSTINMKTDTDCKVTIDGGSEYQLNVGEEVVVWFPKGKHKLDAVSMAGDLNWSRELKMKKDKQELVTVEMQGTVGDLVDEEDESDESDESDETDIYNQEQPFDITILDDMVLVEGGEFMMGLKEGEADEMPRHMVRVGDFYLDKFEVTNAKYCEFLNERGLNIGGDPWLEIESEYCQIEKKGKKFVPKTGYENHPVVKVTWYGAEIYAEWAGKRLPSESEWEYAAGGGKYSQKFEYAGGNHLDVIAWFENNALGETRPVGSKLPNELGIFDMSGNVWEWCQDWYNADYYKNSPKDNPPGPGNGEFRVLRGGSAKGTIVDKSLLIANRNWNKPDWGNYLHGFRCVLDVATTRGAGLR